MRDITIGRMLRRSIVHRTTFFTSGIIESVSVPSIKGCHGARLSKNLESRVRRQTENEMRVEQEFASPKKKQFPGTNKEEFKGE